MPRGGGGHSGGGHGGGGRGGGGHWAGHGGWHGGNRYSWNRWNWPGYGTSYYNYLWPGYGLYNDYVAYNPIQSTYGNCDCSMNGNIVTSNNCNSGTPVCTGGNCTCYNIPTQTSGCFNTRGAIC